MPETHSAKTSFHEAGAGNCSDEVAELRTLHRDGCKLTSDDKLDDEGAEKRAENRCMYRAVFHVVQFNFVFVEA